MFMDSIGEDSESVGGEFHILVVGCGGDKAQFEYGHLRVADYGGRRVLEFLVHQHHQLDPASGPGPQPVRHLQHVLLQLEFRPGGTVLHQLGPRQSHPQPVPLPLSHISVLAGVP